MSIIERMRSILEQDLDLAVPVLELKSEGVSQREIFENLESFRQELEAQGKELKAEYVWEVGDRVWGFCSEQNRLFETSLSRADFDSKPKLET